MRFLVVLAALIGVSLAFENGYEYKYQYKALLETGLPEIRQRYSLLGLKADITFQVNSLKDVVVKIDNLQEARGIYDAVGGMEGYTNPKYVPASKNLSALMSPYTINYLANKKEPIMKSDASDLEWHRNMRKAIASLVKPFQNFDVLLEESVDIVMEDSLYGNCETTYVSRPIDKEDFPFVQSNNQNYPTPKFCVNGAYNVSRTFNFDRCNDQVLIQTNGLGNTTSYFKNQDESYESRSSTAFFIVCAPEPNPKVYDVANTTAHGSFVTNPFGFETEKIQTHVNQTMVLKKKASMKKPHHIASETSASYTWNMEVSSPFMKGDDDIPWVNFNGKTDDFTAYSPESVTTGFPMNDELRESFKNRIAKNINDVTKLLKSPYNKLSGKKDLYDNPYSEAADKMSDCSKMAKALPENDLQDLYKLLVVSGSQGEEKDTVGSLFLDTLAASGSSLAYKVLLEHMNNDISATRTKSIYFTLTNSLANPEVLVKFMDAVKDMKFDDNSYTTATAFLNFANAVRRFCGDRHSPSYAAPQPILGRANCNEQEVVPKFIELVEDKLNSAKFPYEKAVMAETLANLGSTEALPLLKKVMDGFYGNDASVRAPAVYALLKKRMPSAPMTEVAKQLFRMIEAYNEEPQLRQAAVLTYLSWEPNAEFYKRLARLTWQDPSHQLKAFTHSLLYGMANSHYPGNNQQAQYAMHALRFAKPHAPSSMFAYSYLWADYLPRESLSAFSAFNFVHANDSGIPRESTAYLYNAYGGLNYSPFMQYVSAYNVDDIVYKILGQLENSLNAAPNSRKMRRGSGSEYINFEEVLKEELGFNGDKLKPYQFFFVTRLFEEMEFFAPVDDSILGNLPNYGRKWIDVLLEGTTLNIVKFFDPASNENYFPTELGIPLFHRSRYPTIISFMGDAKMKTTHRNQPSFIDLLSTNKTSLNLNTRFKFFSNFQTTVSALIPWNQKAVSAGAKSYRGVCLPVNYIVSLTNHLNFGQINRTVSHYFEPTYRNRFQVYHAHNVPFVAVHGMWPGDAMDTVKVVTVRNDNKPQTDIRHDFSRDYTGFDSYLKFTGDADYPFTRGYLQAMLSQPQKAFEVLVSPSAKHWDFDFIVDFSSQETKSVNTSSSFWVPSTYFSENNANFTRAQKSNPDSVEDFRYGMTFRIHLNGTQNRFYELSAATSKQFKENSFSKSVSRVVFHRSALPGTYNQASGTCWQAVIDGPNPYDYASLKKLLNDKNRLQYDLVGDFYTGKTCDNNQAGSMQGSIGMSSPMVENLKQNIGNNGQWTPETRGEPYYDQVSFNMNYKSEKIPPQLRNFTYMAHDTFLAYAAPFFSANYLNVNNPDEQIKVTGKRLLGSHKWQVTVNMPKEDLFTNNQNFWYATYKVLDAPGAETLEHHCMVTNTKVQSADGKRVRMNPYVVPDCWVLTAINRRHPSSFQVFTRQTPKSGLQAMVSSDKYKLNVEFNYEQVTVNDKPFQVTEVPQWIKGGPMGNFAQVFKKGDVLELVIPGNFSMQANKNFMVVYPYQELQSSLGGLCGDFNSENMHDSVGPKHCIYNEFKQFASSWLTSVGDSCNKGEVTKIQQSIKEFQKTCSRTAQSSEKPSPLYHVEKDCLEFIYPIKTQNDGTTCVSDSAVGYCMPKCKLTKTLSLQQSYSCWSSEWVPSDVKKNTARGYMKSPPTQKSQFTLGFSTKSAFVCHYD